MNVDLVQRVYREKSLGNPGPIAEFDEWLQFELTQPGKKFVVEGKTYSWKIISAAKFDHIISERETDWMLIHSETLDLSLLGKVHFHYSNLIGERDRPSLGSFWLLKSKLEGLEIDNEPISISSPHWFATPKHRNEADMIKLISRLQDKNVPITQWVDYKTYRTHSIRIR